MIAALILAAVTAAQQFADLPLNAALAHAVQISPDVAQARERVAENASLLAAARGLAAPALVANYTQAPQGGSNNDTITQRLASVGAQITLGDYLAYSPAVRQAAFTLSTAQFDLLDAQRAERVKVIGQYYAALSAGATVTLRAQEVTTAKTDLHAAQLRFRAGDAPRLDVVRSQVALATASAAFDAAQVDLANASNALSVETGVPAQKFSKVTAAVLAKPPAQPDRAVARALAQRSELATAQQAVRAEQAAVRVAERGALPAVTVNAGYMRGVDSGVRVSGPQASVNLVFPISHAAADRAAAERARLAAAQYKEASIRRQIAVGVGASARTYGESSRALASATRARVAAQEELRATEIGYRSGASSSLDVADARRTYEQAALAELSALYAQAQAAATLEQEIGP